MNSHFSFVFFYKEMLESYIIANVEMLSGKTNTLQNKLDSRSIVGSFPLLPLLSTFNIKQVASFLRLFFFKK